ncbi:MAG TPA: penicillin-binding transpeptidase domain-containing protein [Patescibacteria group bacterium]
MYSFNTSSSQSWLSWFFRGLLFLAVAILISRLGELQIIKGAYYKDLADGNRIRRIVIPAPRGRILARGGEVLAGNTEIKKRIVFDPLEGYKKIDDVKDAKPDELISEYVRKYPYGADFGHVTGYVGAASGDEVGKIDPDCPDHGPIKPINSVGRSGIEAGFECQLRGIDGEELIEVNSMGHKIRVLGTKEPVPGKDLVTTFDAGIQRKTALSMKDKKGAAAVTDGHGQILALYSSPSYDPNVFIQNDFISKKTRGELLANPDLPLFDRTISGEYHPGSIFKIVTASAALEEKKITPDFTYNDTGVIKIGDFSYTNWYFTQYGSTEGVIGLTKAIARSTDTFFYKVGELTGVDLLDKWAQKFGLGTKTGVNLPGEASGLVPSPAWKRQAKGELWFLGNTYHMAIGQGDLTVTPLQANAIASVISTKGKLCEPRMIAADVKCKDLGISQSTLDEIKEGMIGACSTGGTAYPFFDFKPQVACKTGTAETNEKDKTHAWFNAIAPVDPSYSKSNAQIVATILVEKGGEGSQVAAPIAKDIISYWTQRQ